MESRSIKLQPRKIGAINWVGLETLVRKEVGRFLNVYLQTIIAPLVTLVLFFTVFSLSFGGGAADPRQILGVSYMTFIAPGLLMMTMAQNAFSNSSSSLVIGKVQGNIIDLLMPPLGPFEILSGFAIGAVLRALLIGACGTVILSVFAHIPFSNVAIIIVFALLGSLLMGGIGILAGLWSDKFDHIAAITNFVVTPMTFLSGTFYALGALPDFWQKVALLNPFFYMIDGFRGGFIGAHEAGVTTGLIVLLLANIVAFTLAWRLLATGYKVKS